MTKQLTVFRLLIPLHSLGLFDGLHVIDQIDPSNHRLTLCVRLSGTAASCPGCRTESRRVQGHYWRCLGDLPCFGRPVILRVQVRRFRCVNDACPRRTFGEPLPRIARCRARQTDRLRSAHHAIALALGGNPGARLARRTGMPIGGTTLLRRIREADLDPPLPPRVLGVDDWAWRKGQSYGTILCDLERGRRVELLPDRKSETLAAWLKDHPSVEIIVRDRAGAYADGARQGAPQAIQVADRWHLLRNSSDALRGVLDHHHRHLDEAAQIAVASLPDEPAADDNTLDAASAQDTGLPVTKAEQRSLDAQQRRDARFEEAVRLRDQGMTLRGIARALGIGRKTVRRWLRAGHAPTWRHADRSILDPFRDYLEMRWAAGCRNGTGLWREIRERGYAGRPKTVQEWVRHRLRRLDPAPAGSALSTPAWKAPSGRRAAWLVVAEAGELDDTERKFVDALITGAPPLVPVITLARAFRALVREKQADKLDDWLTAAQATALAGFVGGLKRDLAAVRAGLSLPWSTGPVEGQISRLKTIKRTMCGRAGFDLLRHRVLEAA